MINALIGTGIMVGILGVISSLLYVLTKFRDNYRELYEKVTIVSCIMMFFGFVANVFLGSGILSSWIVGVFLLLSFPALHRWVFEDIIKEE